MVLLLLDGKGAEEDRGGKLLKEKIFGSRCTGRVRASKWTAISCGKVLVILLTKEKKDRTLKKKGKKKIGKTG